MEIKKYFVDLHSLIINHIKYKKMSKQSEAKDNQGYRKDAPMCKNCSLFTSKVEEVKSKWSSQTFKKESEFRCTMGGFKVMKMSWCKYHDFAKPKIA